MELQQILGFYHVSRLKSFTRAAEATYRTQSALSQQIKSLEQELGCQLLEKAGNTVLRLTTEGEAFLQFAESILQEQDIVLEKIKKLKGENVGSITVAAPFNSMAYLLPPHVERFIHQHERISIRLLEMTPFHSLEMLSSGEVDCAVTMISAVPKKFSTQRWKTAEYTLVLKDDHPLAAQTDISLEDIAQCPLILPLRDTKSAPRIKLLKAIDEMGLESRIVMEASGYFMIQNYVKKGLGVGFCLIPTEIVDRGEPGLKLVPVRSIFGHEYIAIVLRKDKYISAPLRIFIDSLLEYTDPDC